MTQFNMLVEMAVAHAKETLAEDGQLLPTWFVVTGNDVLLPARTVWENFEEKKRWLVTMRAALAMVGAKRYALVCEAWMVSTDSRTEADAIRRAPVSLETRPDREEVIDVVAEDRNGKQFHAFIPFARKGKRIVFADMISTTETIDSRFANLLRPAGAPH